MTQTQVNNFIHPTSEGITRFSVVTNVTYDRGKMSNVSPHNVCQVQFGSTLAIDAWECRAALASNPSGVGIGSLLAGGGAIPALTLWDGTVSWNGEKLFGHREGGELTHFNVTAGQLVFGDGVYRISVYVQVDGIWYG